MNTSLVLARRFSILACALPLALSACTPTPLQMAYGASVAAAAREGDDLVTREPQADLGLELAINRVWLDVSRTRFTGLDTDAQGGVVRVWGEVANIDDHIEALRLVWSLPGVIALEPEVRIGGDPNRDLVRADIIMARLIDDPGVRDSRFSIEVIDQSVYLLGRAQDQIELNRVIRHAHASGDVTRVITLVHVEKAGA